MKYWIKFINDGRDVPKTIKLMFDSEEELNDELAMLEAQNYEIIDTFYDYEDRRHEH